MHEIRERRAETRDVDNIFEMLREIASLVRVVGELQNENVTNVTNGDVIYRNLSEWKAGRGISRGLTRNENSMLLLQLCNYRLLQYREISTSTSIVD